MFTRFGLATRSFPAPEQLIGIGRIRWGRHEEICTPAYWASQAWMLEMEEPDHFRLGDTLAEETLACVLGGHGIPAEVGMAAYYRLREALHEDGIALKDPVKVERLLREPLNVRGKAMRYRFAAQKTRYVVAAMSALESIDEAIGDRALRDTLVTIPGIGLKTASWIVRNWRRSDEVSILDIHILRAGSILGIFQDKWKVERHYLQMEAAYLEFARRIGIRASILDSVMWASMREIPSAFVKSMQGKETEHSFYPVHTPEKSLTRQLTLI